MGISLRLNDNDAALVKSYAKMHGLSVSEFARQAMLDRIEDEFDLADLNEAIAEWEDNPVTYSHEEAWRLIEREQV